MSCLCSGVFHAMRGGVCVCVSCVVCRVLSLDRHRRQRVRDTAVLRKETTTTIRTRVGGGWASERERETHARDDEMEIATASSRTGSLIWQMPIREPSRFPIPGGFGPLSHPHPIPIPSPSQPSHSSNTHHITAQHSIKAPGGLDARAQKP